MRYSYYILDDADEDHGPTTLRPVVPRRRDWWRVLLGRYKPWMEAHRAITVKGADKLLKKHYIEPIAESLHKPHLFLWHNWQDSTEE